jgi:hypothetical protein
VQRNTNQKKTERQGDVIAFGNEDYYRYL